MAITVSMYTQTVKQPARRWALIMHDNTVFKKKSRVSQKSHMGGNNFIF